MDFGWATLLKGRTSAHFHNFGTLPFLIEALKMEQIGKLKVLDQLFRIQFGISSGPVALRSFTRDGRTSNYLPYFTHFATKFCNSTKFKMLVLTVVKDFVLLA